MRRPAVFLAAGGLAFLSFLVILLPAAVVMRWAPAQVSLAGLSGTLWSGQARELRLSGQPLGALQWRCSYWRILLLQWSCELQLRPVAGDVSLHVTRYPNGKLRLQDVSGQLPISLLEGLFTPPGWSGQAELDLTAVEIVGDWPELAEGVVRVRSLKAPGAGGATLGDFELVVGEGAVGTEQLQGRLSDLGGPLRVRATLTVSPTRDYLIHGEVAPGPGANDAIFRTLAFLGQADSLGRRPFTIEGDF